MTTICTIRTAGGDRLWGGSDTGGAVFARAVPLGTHAEVLLLVSDHRPGVAFLAAADGCTPVRVGAELRGGPVLPVRVQWNAGRTSAALLHPYTGAYVAAPPAAPGRDRGDLTAHQLERSGHERFLIGPVSGPVPDLAAMLALLDRFAAAPLTGPAILALLEQGIGPDAAAAFSAYARLLPLDQLTWLAEALLRSGPARASLAAAFPGDLWATEALPRLAWWNSARMPAARMEVPATQTDLSVAGQDGIHVSFPHLCSSLARRSVAPRKIVAVLATARNEGPYLLEWIAHYRSIGVEHFFIYSNDNTDGSEALLNALAQAGVITWISNPVPPGRVAQFQAYGHAFGVLPQILDYRWTLVVDLDELLFFDQSRFASLPDYLAWQEGRPVDAIAFNWVVFGSSGEARWRDAPMVERFGHRMPYTDHHVKVAVRSGLPMHAHPHRAVFDPRQAVVIRGAAGDVHLHTGDPSLSAQPEESTVWVNHYFFKSAEEFIWKVSRNRGDQPVRARATEMDLDLQFAEMFLQQHTSAAMLPDTRLLTNADARNYEIGKLLSLPNVFQAIQATKFIFGEQIATIREVLRADARFRVEGSIRNSLAKAACFLFN